MISILGIPVHTGYDIHPISMDEPLLRCVARESDFRVESGFGAKWTCNGVYRERNSPAGWGTDLASVPQIATPVVPAHRLIKRPAILHDDLYGNRPIFDGVRITRGEADAVLYAFCIWEGMPEDEAKAVYLAVRVGGSSIWHAHDEYFAQLDKDLAA